MAVRMEKVFIPGETVKFMMENGIKDSNKVMEYGKEYIRIRILVSGRILRHMVMEFIHGQMVINMRVNGTCASNMAKEQTHLQPVKVITETMLMASLKEKVNTNGKMDKYTLETSQKVRSMEKENGKAHSLYQTAISMREIMQMI